MSQGSLDPKIRFIGQKVCSVARVQTDRHTDRQTRKWIQRTPFQGFRNFSFNLSSRIGPKMRENDVYKASPRLFSLSLVESCKKSRHPLSLIELKSKRECAQTYWNTWNVHTNCFDIAVYKHLLGRSLMIGWRKKSWNPERVPSVVTLSVCLCVCVSVRGLQVTSFDLRTYFI